MTKIKKRYYSWPQLMGDCLTLAKRLKQKKIDFIVAITRGGLIPATFLAYKLNIKKIRTIGYSHYSNIAQRKKPELILPADAEIKNSKVLLIDEKAETGTTLLAAIDLLKKRKNKIITLTLHWNPQSKIKPDYFARKVKNVWIVYPWDRF